VFGQNKKNNPPIIAPVEINTSPTFFNTPLPHPLNNPAYKIILQ
jgi:hypothetical protein